MIKADVLVIGGGIMGASAALDIARHSKLSVTLLEKTMCGAQASGANFGNIRFYDWPQNQMPFAIRARHIWHNLKSLIGTDGEFNATGSLRITFEEADLDMLSRYMQEATGYDFGFELLKANAFRDRYPWFHGSTGAMWSPRDGNANPRLVAAAFGLAAARAGVNVVEQAEVIAAGYANGAFKVETADGRTFGAERLINCSGAWSNRIAGFFGEQVPLLVHSPQQAVTEVAPAFSLTMMSCFGNFYFRQTPRGNVLIGGGDRSPADLATSKHHVVPTNTARLINKVVSHVPALKGLRIIRGWGGVEGYTPDSLPVIGPSKTAPGLFHTFGFSGSGFQLGPAVGETIGEIIRTGRPTIPIDAFAIDREALVSAEA